ncbi:MAG: alpha/beta hydrolase [Comamonadaceae bacterium]|jgi:pimeloyl-ACP methyl ester carboxylesterase|nr:alpha/beta hydrolase [Comamonadaceae bacterium]
MTEPQLHQLECPDAAGGHRMAYWQWGQSDSAAVVLCVHGLTRQGRDFDVLARALIDRASAHGQSLRVICPDVVGRGASAWLGDPAQYHPTTYAADMQALLAHLHVQAPVIQLDWVGTSMGGIIGMIAAAQPQSLPQPIRRLVLNDVGPRLSWVGLSRIKQYVGRGGPFASMQDALDVMRQNMASFGPHTDAQWQQLNTPMFKPTADGSWALHYDPAIAQPLQPLTEAINDQSSQVMQALYERITAQTLLLRGADSDLLTREDAQAMTQCGPRARLLEFAGVGHAPTLMAADQVRAVLDFLLPV